MACAGRVFEKSWIPFRSGDPIPHDSGSGPSGLSGCLAVAAWPICFRTRSAPDDSAGIRWVRHRGLLSAVHESVGLTDCLEAAP